MGLSVFLLNTPPLSKLRRSLFWWCVERQRNCEGAGGGDLDLSKILFWSAVCRPNPADIVKGTNAFRPLPFLLWCHFFFFLSLVCCVRISFSFLHTWLIPALLHSLAMPFCPSTRCSEFTNYWAVGGSVGYIQYSEHIGMKTLIFDTFILPAFSVPSMYYCVCFLIKGEKIKKIQDYSF